MAFARHPRGFALVVFLLTLPVLWFGLKGAFSVYQSAQHSRANQSAVDRAAYSVAAQWADGLNDIAIHNQAVIGAHLLEGHLVTQLAWTRYSAQVLQRGGSIMALVFPQAGAATVRAAQAAVQLQEKQAPLLSKSLSAWAQTHAWRASLKVAELGVQLSETLEQAGGGRVTGGYADPRLLAAFGREELTGEVRQKALAGRGWLSNRSASNSLFFLAKLKKQGGTRESAGQWTAEDKLTLEIRKLFRKKRITLARGAASSRAWGYAGPAALTSFSLDEAYVLTRAPGQVSFGHVLATQPAGYGGVLLWPVWDAQLKAPGSWNF